MLNMKKTYILSVALLAIIVIQACTKKEDVTQVPIGAVSGPALPLTAFDYLSGSELVQSNMGITFSNDIITLGRVLFYDQSLSLNNQISCGSCHIQSKGFADNVKFHKGAFGNTLKRNTLSITGNGVLMFWDGRANGMKDLVLKPIANHKEMVQDPNVLVEKLKLVSYYKELFKKAYGVETIDLKGIENALAAFCAAILPRHSKFDKEIRKNFSSSFFSFVNSSTTFVSFTPQENEGLSLFFGKARCSNCHRPDEVGSTYGSSSSTVFANIGLEMNYEDQGLGSVFNMSSLNGAFKVPNIKNVALTAPYMHDGRFNTLEEVIEHYNTGIKPNVNLSPKLFEVMTQEGEIDLFNGQSTVNMNAGPVQPVKLGLTLKEKQALVAFLKTLTDEELISDIKFSNPFK